MPKGPKMIYNVKHFDVNPIKTNKKAGLKKLEEIKQSQIERILSLEPILARGILDHLIGFIDKSDPPKLGWRQDAIENYDVGDLISVINILENRRDEQQKTF